jgi:FAD-dependent urate hydroxylase
MQITHLFNHGAFASLGAIANDIPGVSSGGGRLATRITPALFEGLAQIGAELAA